MGGSRESLSQIAFWYHHQLIPLLFKCQYLKVILPLNITPAKTLAYHSQVQISIYHIDLKEAKQNKKSKLSSEPFFKGQCYKTFFEAINTLT